MFIRYPSPNKDKVAVAQKSCTFLSVRKSFLQKLQFEYALWIIRKSSEALFLTEYVRANAF